jgi:pimeloyl-ACP methyl ester carboxylesterase
MQADPRRFFRLFLYGLSGDAPPDLLHALYLHKKPDAKLLDGIPEPPGPLGWLTDADLDFIATEYAHTGLTGALSRYRSLDRDWAELTPLNDVPIDQPMLFVGGERDSAVVFGDLDPPRALPHLHDLVLLPDCGHWVQQERPTEVNTQLTNFLLAL